MRAFPSVARTHTHTRENTPKSPSTSVHCPTKLNTFSTHTLDTRTQPSVQITRMNDAKRAITGFSMRAWSIRDERQKHASQSLRLFLILLLDYILSTLWAYFKTPKCYGTIMKPCARVCDATPTRRHTF